MKKLILILSILVGFSTSAFAAWTCTKPNNPSALSVSEDGLNVTVTCTNGTETQTLTRPVFRPQAVAEVKNSIRNVAAELRDKEIAKNRARTIKTNFDSVNFSTSDSAPDVVGASPTPVP